MLLCRDKKDIYLYNFYIFNNCKQEYSVYRDISQRACICAGIENIKIINIGFLNIVNVIIDRNYLHITSNMQVLVFIDKIKGVKTLVIKGT